MLNASGLGDKVGSQPKVLDESQDKTTRTDEGTSTKPGVSDVPKYLSESENESWVDSGDDNNDDDSNEVTKDDDENDVESDTNEDKEEEEKEEEDVHTLDSFEFNDDDEDYDELYKDVNVRLKVAEHEEVGKGDAEMTDTAHENASHEKLYEQVIEDAHVTLTSSQNTEVSKQSSSVSSNFASKFLNLDNVSPVIDEVASMMNVKTPHEESSTKILPKEISNFATPVIQSTINESLENVVLAKSFSQPRSTYEAATSITKFDLKKILLDKLEKSKPYRPVEQHRDLCDALVKSYQLDKDLFDSYGKTYSLKRGHEDKDKDEDPPADQTKGSKSQSKSSSKSAQAEEPVFETVDTKMPQDQGDDLGNTEDQSNVEEASKNDWFKKPKRPPTPDRDWNAGNQINFRPPQTWINKMAKVEKPPTTFDELINTPIDFSAYVLGHLKIENLTQECLVGLAFNLLKRTCKSRVELEYHFEECYKAVNDRLDLHNPEEHVYPFNLSKPLPLIEDQGRQVVPANYFFNNDLEYLKGGSSSGKYTTSTTKTNAAKYDNIEGIKDMLQMLWSPVKVNLSNMDKDDLYDLNVALQMSNISSMTLYTAYYNPQGIIYQDKFKRNRLMRSDKLYKFCDDTLTSVRRVLHDIASSLEMDYLPKIR
ncbi:hypothetical protein Tco_0637268 [Tanacetum coccineum]